MNEPTGDTPPPGPGDGGLLARASDIFFEVRDLPLPARDEAIDRACVGSQELTNLVLLLLRGDNAPLPVESLADDIRGIHDARTATQGASRAGGGPEASSRIGNYRLLERIGEGGFGVVYAAEQEQPVRRRVALKIIKLGMDTRQVVARFEAERQALAMMDHPGIAKVFDAGSTPTGRPYFVMELVRGLPITQYCDQHKLPIRARLELMAQVCEALQHAHTKGVIHRDIKPSNVLVTTVGDKPVPKIIDFGVAKATSSGASGRLTDKTIFTEFRQLVGTPEYMSPEQAGESGHDVDTRTDVYAAGVLLYELLTGSTPFDSRRLRSAAFGELLRIIREEDPPRPSTRITTLPATMKSVAAQRATQATRLPGLVRGELDWIVMKAMEKDRARRYATAGSMAADLQRYLTGHAVEAAPPGAAYRVRKFVRRNKGPVIAGSLLAVALVAGLIGTSVGFFRAEKQRKVAVSEKERAEAERTRADMKTVEAFAAEAVATRRAYSANMMSASTAINGLQFGAARSFLDAAPERLRGWEWRVLDARLDSSTRTIPTDRIRIEPHLTHLYQLLPHPDLRSFLTTDLRTGPVSKGWSLEDGRLLTTFEPGPMGRRIPGFHPTCTLVDDGATIHTPMFAEGPNDQPRGVVVIGWDAATGERTSRAEVARPGHAAIRAILSPDAKRVLLVSATSLWVQRVSDGVVLAEVEPESLLNPLAWSPDGAMIAFKQDRDGGQSEDVALRDAASLVVRATLVGHTGWIASASFSTDSRWLGTGADDRSARVWDLSAQPPTAQVLPHPFAVGGIRFSADGSLVATICRDRAIRVWDRATGTLQATYAGQSLANGPLMFLEGGASGAGASIAGQDDDGTVRFWDTTAEDTTVLRGHQSIVAHARFASGNPAGIIISGSWEGANGSTGTVRLWDADSGDPVAVLQGRPGDIVRSVDVSANGGLALVGIDHSQESTDAVHRMLTLPPGVAIGRVDVIDLTTGTIVATTPSAGTFNFVRFSNGDRELILGCWLPGDGLLGRLRRINARTGAVHTSIDVPRSECGPFAVSPDGLTLAIIADPDAPGANTNREPVIRQLDAQTLEPVREVAAGVPSVGTITFSPDAQRLAVGGTDGLLHVFDVSSGTRLASLSGHGMQIYAVAFSPDGKRIASAGLDRNVRIWDAVTFDQLAAFGGHEGHIGGLDWDRTPTPSPGGDFSLVSCSGDSTLRIWEPAPIRTRVQAREARRAALAVVEPIVAGLFEELKDAAKVAERLNADATLTPVQKKTALQVVLRTGLSQRRTTGLPSSPPQKHGGDLNRVLPEHQETSGG